MSFGLRNARETSLIGRTLEVYVDDMLVKSKQAISHIRDLQEIFEAMKVSNQG